MMLDITMWPGIYIKNLIYTDTNDNVSHNMAIHKEQLISDIAVSNYYNKWKHVIAWSFSLHAQCTEVMWYDFTTI